MPTPRKLFPTICPRARGCGSRSEQGPVKLKEATGGEFRVIEGFHKASIRSIDLL